MQASFSAVIYILSSLSEISEAVLRVQATLGPLRRQNLIKVCVVEMTCLKSKNVFLRITYFLKIGSKKRVPYVYMGR